MNLKYLSRIILAIKILKKKINFLNILVIILSLFLVEKQPSNASKFCDSQGCVTYCHPIKNWPCSAKENWSKYTERHRELIIERKSYNQKWSNIENDYLSASNRLSTCAVRAWRSHYKDPLNEIEKARKDSEIDFQGKVNSQEKKLTEINNNNNKKREIIEKSHSNKQSKSYSIDFYNLILNYEVDYISGHRDVLFSFYNQYISNMNTIIDRTVILGQYCEENNIGFLSDKVLQVILTNLLEIAKNLQPSININQ